MQTKIKVTVKDVNGKDLNSALIKVIHTSIDTDRTEKDIKPADFLDINLAVNEFSLIIRLNNFEDELYVFGKVGSTWKTTNPASIIVDNGIFLDISIKLGIVRLAPGIVLPPDAILNVNPQAAIIDKLGFGNWIYRDARHNDEPFIRLDEPIFGNLNGIEWDRFKHTPHLIELSKLGQFALLEFGPQPVLGSQLPRFLIGTWIPFKPLSKTPEVLVFYSPPTFESRGYPPDKYPFLKNYPYAITYPGNLNKPNLSKDATQLYVNILVQYILIGYKIIYQLLAAGRNPIIIMPSQSSANWGSLDSQSGICRLVKEVLRFLYAKQLVSSQAQTFTRLSLAVRPQIIPLKGLFTSESVPETFAITISGFSAGISPIVKLCTMENFDEKLYPPNLFYSPPNILLSNWREIWDVDGVPSQGWEHMVKIFRTWLNGNRRTLRSYHSETTFKGSKNGFVNPALIVRKPEQPIKGVWAEEGSSKDRRITWVYFSNASLTGDTKAKGHQMVIPEFGKFDAHHFVPAIAFGHAAQFPLP